MTEFSPSPASWKTLKQRVIEEDKKSKPCIVNKIEKLIKVQPGKTAWLNWRTITVGALVLLLSVGLIFTAPSFLKQDYKTLAANISLSNPSVQEIINERGIATVNEHVIDKIDDRGHTFVVLINDPDYILISEVNFETEEVVQLYEIELNDDTKQTIIDIAGTDPAIKDFLEQGAHASEFEIYWGYKFDDVIGQDGNVQQQGKLHFTGYVKFELEERSYYSYVNITDGYIDSAYTPLVISPNSIFTPIAFIMHLLGIIIIIALALQNKILMKITGTLSIIFAVMGLLCGLFAVQWVMTNLIGTFSIPIFGSIIGAVGIKMNTTGNNRILSILGTSLCIIVFILDMIFFMTGIIVLEPVF
ncbi:MAG: hypothetical protein PHF74_04480 [Dehalococcoidales bacterium]|nr:hypothetical protein [Dehalococcoidales bacterium]